MSGQVRLFDTPVDSFRDWHRIGYVPQRTTAAGGVPATVREIVASGGSRTGVRSTGRHGPTGRPSRTPSTSSASPTGPTRASLRSPGAAAAGADRQGRGGPARPARPRRAQRGVDRASQEAFARALRTFVASGRTLLLVLHDMGPLAPLVDRCVVLDAGFVVHDGPLPLPSGVAGMPHGHIHAADPGQGMFG